MEKRNSTEIIRWILPVLAVTVALTVLCVVLIIRGTRAMGNARAEDAFSRMEEAVEEGITEKEAASGSAGSSEESTAAPEAASDIFAEIAGTDFLLTSGAGAWGASLVLNEDGSFSGGCHDSEMGDSGEGYPNGTIYLSNYSGTFKNPVRISDHVYTLELDTLVYENDGEEKITEDGVRYVYEEVDWLKEGAVFTLYLPGTPRDELPEDFVQWVSEANCWQEFPEELPFYGLYNPDGSYSFFSSSAT